MVRDFVLGIGARCDGIIRVCPCQSCQHDKDAISFFLKLIDEMGLATIIRKSKLKERQMRILILGLDNAGKSTVVAQWTGGDIRQVAPTFGFKIKTILIRSYQLHFWDIGGQRTIRPYWRNYFEETDGLVFVIDSAAPHRLGEAMEELAGLLGQDRLANASILILANKQDCPGALTLSQIEAKLQLINTLGDKSGKTPWRLFGCSAVQEQDERIAGSLQWLITNIGARLYHVNA